MMRHWYVVHTKPRQESVAIANLARQGYTVYCPRTIQSRYRRQRWQKVEEPLFPRYLFMQLAVGIDDFAPIRSTLGVDGLVSFGCKPAIMSQEAIDAIHDHEHQLTNQYVARLPWQPGDRVELIGSAFSGLSGVFEAAHGSERVMVLLEMLGRMNRITIESNKVISAR